MKEEGIMPDNRQPDAAELERFVESHKVSNSISTYLLGKLEKMGKGNFMTKVFIATAGDYKKLQDQNPAELTRAVLFDLEFEYKILSSLYTQAIAMTYPTCFSRGSLISDKLKLDSFLLKLKSTARSLQSAEGQFRVNGKTVNIAYAQQFLNQSPDADAPAGGNNDKSSPAARAPEKSGDNRTELGFVQE